MAYKLRANSLQRLKGWKIKNFRPVFQQFGMSFRRGMAALFANTGGRVNANQVIDGITWAPLNPEYKAWKANIVPFGTLVFGGEMADSFRRQGAPGNIEEIGDFEAAYGSSHWLAKFHQYGTKFMPARPIIFDSSKRREVFMQTMADYFNAKFEQIGLDVRVTLNAN